MSTAAGRPAISRLEIRDLVVIAAADLELGPGLTAITGETGAGKTVLATALGLLAGEPADSAAVRPGAAHALIQAELLLPEGYWDSLEEDDPLTGLAEFAEDPAAVVVGRRIPASGRSRTLVDGQVAPRAQVAALVRSRLHFSGQHEQRRLSDPRVQMEILDRFAGPEVADLAARLTAVRSRARAAAAALARRASERERALRERGLLEELVEAVEQAGIELGEEERLEGERTRLMNLDALAQAAAGAIAAVSPEDGEGALAQAALAGRVIGEVAATDPALGPVLLALEGAGAQLAEASSLLHGYLADLEAPAGALEAIEERLDLYRRLSRRYGPGTETVLARASSARARLDGLEDDSGEQERLETEHRALVGRARELAGELSRARAAAAPLFAEAVQDELAQLAMTAARVRVELTADDGEDPPRQLCRFMLQANPGLPEGPLARIASGGEMSRVLLALHGVAAGGAGAGAWVFDEVDAGIGGATAVAVAERLRALSRTQQVVVITHLPQVTALADRHYRLVKDTEAALSTTRIEPLTSEEALLAELCRMLGARPEDPGARRHASELLARRAVS